MDIETKTLACFVFLKDIYEKVSPYFSEEYLSKESEKIVYRFIKDYYDKYGKSPTKDALLITLRDYKSNNQSACIAAEELIRSLERPEEKPKWLIKNIEAYVKDRAIHRAVLKTHGIYTGEITSNSIYEIPDILKDAISVSFDDRVGHDLKNDLDARYDFYTARENRIEFDLDLLNKITNGGIKSKTLNLFVGATGGCKSLTLCHCAASFLMSGKNVLYLTLEMSENAIAERIDANLLDINIHNLKYLSRNQYKQKFNEAVRRTSGNLVIKEFPTGGAHANNFRFLMKDLKRKKGFVADVVIVDYLTICNSYKSNVEGWAKGKAVAEELRGLAVVEDVPILSAVQLNRSGASSSEPTLTDIGESYGIAQTGDLALCLVSNDELEAVDQIMVIQLKNRYNSVSSPKKFRFGIDKSKMKLYNLENAAVTGQINSNIEDLKVPEPNFDFSTDTESTNLLNSNFDFDFEDNDKELISETLKEINTGE